MATDKLDNDGTQDGEIVKSVLVCGSHAADITKALASLEPRFWNRIYSKEVLTGIRNQLSAITTIEDIVILAVENIMLREDVFAAQMRNGRLREAIELFGMNDASMEVDLKGIITEVNDKFLELSGYSREELIGQSTRILSSKTHSKDFWKKFWGTIFSGAIFEGDIHNRKKNGDIFVLHTIVRPMMENGKIVSFQVVRQDVTELDRLKRDNDELLHQKIHVLTGLPNRSKLLEDLSVPSLRTLVILHLNRMSEINSGFGHEGGNAALVQVADFLRQQVPETDGSIYKLEGADYAVVFNGDNTKTDIEAFKSKISSLQAFHEGNTIPLSFSAGMVVDGPAGHETVIRAYLALHQSKEKSDFVFFNHDLATTSDFRQGLEMESLVKMAFEEDLFVPYYQKIKDNRGEEGFVPYVMKTIEENSYVPLAEKTEKFECFVRMYDSSERVTLISPGRFLPAAKKTRQLRHLTRLMIDKTFDFMSGKATEFSINLTGEDLSSADFVAFVLEKSKQFGIPSSRVIFEILEEIESLSSDQRRLVIMELKKNGFRIAVDDFGVQHSNFERIFELKPDFLKIDIKFIKNIDKNKLNYYIVKSMVELAHNCGIFVIAEGVERQEEQDVLLRLSVDYSQGFLHSTPSPHL